MDGKLRLARNWNMLTSFAVDSVNSSSLANMG